MAREQLAGFFQRLQYRLELRGFSRSSRPQKQHLATLRRKQTPRTSMPLSWKTWPNHPNRTMKMDR